MDELKNLQAKLDKIYAKLEIEINTKKVLEELGFPIREKGCVYLIFIVKMASKAPNLLHEPQLLYEQLAQTCGVSCEEIENEIGCAITQWWQRERLLRLNGKSNTKYNVFSEAKPTNEAFIAWLMEMRLRKRKSNISKTKYHSLKNEIGDTKNDR